MKHFMIICTAAALTACAIGAETTRSAVDDREADYWKRIGSANDDIFRAASKLDPKKAIGEFEAYVLSRAYFDAYFHTCGATKMPQDKGETWVTETVLGYAGMEIGPKITIEKKTGVTRCDDKLKPTISDPKTYMQFVKVPIKSLQSTPAHEDAGRRD